MVDAAASDNWGAWLLNDTRVDVDRQAGTQSGAFNIYGTT
jgi:hypothetical protein